jgi:hypothetical protein
MLNIPQPSVLRPRPSPGPSRAPAALGWRIGRQRAPAASRRRVIILAPLRRTRQARGVRIYGGGWQDGPPQDDLLAARCLASRGYVVFAVDYRHPRRSAGPRSWMISRLRLGGSKRTPAGSAASELRQRPAPDPESPSPSGPAPFECPRAARRSSHPRPRTGRSASRWRGPACRRRSTRSDTGSSPGRRDTAAAGCDRG